MRSLTGPPRPKSFVLQIPQRSVSLLPLYSDDSDRPLTRLQEDFDGVPVRFKLINDALGT